MEGGACRASKSIVTVAALLFKQGISDLGESLDGHADGLEGIAFSPDGNKVATGCWDGAVESENLPPGTPP